MKLSMSKFGHELSPNDAPALPLWVDGHAYLLMADGFQPVLDGEGRTVRKVPLYGDEAVRIAATSAADARAAWLDLPATGRAACLAELAALLARYRAHLEKLLGEEAGLDGAAAQAELDAALVALAGSAPAPEVAARPGGVAAVAGDADAPLAGALACVVAALAAGWAVVVKTSPKAPSALFATCELFSRAGFPAGLVNCIHGDEAAMRALATSRQIGALAFVGSAPRAARVGALAGDTPYVGGLPDAALFERWHLCLRGAGR